MSGHLRAIRAQGARIEPSAHLGGVKDISVPVLGHGGEAVAALTCAYIEHPGEAAEEGRARAMAALKAVAARI